MQHERPLLSLSRRDVDAGSDRVRAALPVEWLAAKVVADGAEELTPAAAGRVDLHVTPAGGENFLVRGEVEATFSASCARCSGPARVAVDAEVTLLLVPKTAAQGRAPKGKHSKDSDGEFEFDPDEADIATYEGELLVFDELVREAILLEVPVAPLCSEDCSGIAADPAVAQKLAPQGDLRLAPLAALRDAMRGETSTPDPAVKAGPGKRSKNSQ
jgi:uncharacterized metal-binding protein YceD (DUF177 family)